MGADRSPKTWSAASPKGTVLGPILFVSYINDLLDNVTSHGLMFADDTKIFRHKNQVPWGPKVKHLDSRDWARAEDQVPWGLKIKHPDSRDWGRAEDRVPWGPEYINKSWEIGCWVKPTSGVRQSQAESGRRIQTLVGWKSQAFWYVLYREVADIPLPHMLLSP